jgi:alkylhydroperoxidase family enzyme
MHGTVLRMPRVSVPAGQDPLMHVWTSLAPPLTGAAATLSDAVYRSSSLSLREFEAARTRMAQINDCTLCLDWRSGRDVEVRTDEADTIDEEFYAHVGDHTWSGFSERERLAAERYALDHTNIDDDMWQRLHAAFTDDELVDLGVCVGSWLAYGRFNRVFDIDGACRIPLP